jgi:hypothetical protein
MPFRRPHYYKKKRRKYGRQRFADGLLLGYVVAALAFLFIPSSDSNS